MDARLGAFLIIGGGSIKLSSEYNLPLGGMNLVFRGIADVRRLPDSWEYFSFKR